MKAAIITGAGSGIGRATALQFARNNYHVFLLGRDPRKLRITHLECGDATSFPCDLTQAQEVESVVKQILSTNKTIECLVNCAGVFTYNTFENTSDEDWIQHFQIHVLGAARITKLFWPHFVKNKKGNIIN
ncbi:MAG: SDR family NAD(P)-dependent oxidoreductase, partial [Bdellovibrionales bacterium]